MEENWPTITITNQVPLIRKMVKQGIIPEVAYDHAYFTLWKNTNVYRLGAEYHRTKKQLPEWGVIPFCMFCSNRWQTERNEFIKIFLN